LSFLVATVTSVAVTFSVVVLIAKLLRLEAPPSSTGLVIGGLFAMTLGGLASRFVSTQLEGTFPKCQFEYGPAWRQQRSKRSLLFVLITVVVLPAALAFIV
jgi:hypothetical protein